MMSIGHMDARRSDPADEVGRGPLSRGAAAVYRMLVLEAQLLLATSPTVAVAVLLDSDASNLPLLILALLPVAPALVAGVSAVRTAGRAADLSPARFFFRAYRRDLGPTLVWSVPATALFAVLSWDLLHLQQVAGGGALRPLLVLVCAALLVWCGHMVLLTAGFHFRPQDAARVALGQLLSQWRWSLGVLALVIIAGFIVMAASGALLLLSLWAIVGLLALMGRPVLESVRRDFTEADSTTDA